MPPTRRYICINATTAAAMETMPVSLFDPALPPNETTSLVTTPSTCSLQDICGFGGFSNPRTPDQAFRFLTPLFVHSGLLHCAVNLAVLMWMGIKLERLMGSWRFIGKEKERERPSLLKTHSNAWYNNSLVLFHRHLWQCIWG